MKLIFQSSTSIVNLLELATAAQNCVHRPDSIKSEVGYLLQPRITSNTQYRCCSQN